MILRSGCMTRLSRVLVKGAGHGSPFSVRRLFSLRKFPLYALMLLSLAGCKSEKSPDQPTVIGTPPRTAYLGVEYYYNFGAYGGDTILGYSLTNAPPWLGLEETSNKARQGIIMRGVPGVTGGGRGRADLGNAKSVNLTTTDGQRLGVQPFDIEIVGNQASLSAAKLREGTETEDVEGAGEGEICAMPEMGKGRHRFTYNTYNDDGSFNTTAEAEADTRSVLIKVLLDQPSVQTTKIAFEIKSDYDPDKCDGTAVAPSKACEFSVANRSLAQIDQDVVLKGNLSGSALPMPDYIQVIDERSGIITLDRNITECFIRLEVVDDNFSEPSETFAVELKEVRQGLVDLGDNGKGITEDVLIADNAPLVSFFTANDLTSTALNEGSTGIYIARLDRSGNEAKATPYKVRLGNDTETANASDADFRFVDKDGKDITELEFASDVDEKTFRVEAVDDSASPPPSEDPAGDGPFNDDEMMTVSPDAFFQDGREFYAGVGGTLDLWINEQTDFLVAGSDDMGLTPNDIVVGDAGRIFIASQFIDSDSGAPLARIDIYNRFGAPEQSIDILASSATPALPKIAFRQRKVSIANSPTFRNEIAIAFDVAPPTVGGVSEGSIDTRVVLLRRDAEETEYTQVWATQVGSAGDDKVKGIDINLTGSVFLSGETVGVWPDNTGNAGGTDAYVQRIDTQTSKTGVVTGALAWTRQVGSTKDDTVVALALQGSTPFSLGYTAGKIGPSAPLGSDDIFFFGSTGSKDVEPDIYQVGSAKSEQFNDGDAVGSNFWMIGEARHSYMSGFDADSDVVLDIGSDTSQDRGFILTYGQDGSYDSALTLSGQDNASLSFDSGTPFLQDYVIGGVTDGWFTEPDKSGNTGGLIFTRINRELVVVFDPDEEIPEGATSQEPTPITRADLSDIARYQVVSAQSANVIAMTSYKGAESYALVSELMGGKTIYGVYTLNGDVEWLNKD